MLYERVLRPFLFRMDAEEAHDRVNALLSFAQRAPLGRAVVSALSGAPVPGLEIEAFGLRFDNPVGLAAGFDKDARLTNVLPELGFGFVEVGSITLYAQPGNEKPRLFRLIDDRAIVNRMGFNNAGAAAAADRLKNAGRATVPVGINLGLNKDAPKEEAPNRYASVFKALEPYGDYFVVNVSSPNTAGLRELQEHLALRAILVELERENPRKKPVLVKLSPDLEERSLPAILDVVKAHAAGVIATNTTLSRDGLVYEGPELRGGLSGEPLRDRSTAMIAAIRRLAGPALPIVGVGGVASGADAFAKIRAGASLVQLYTSLIYQGPGVVRRAQRELKDLLDRHGFPSVAAAVGTAE